MNSIFTEESLLTPTIATCSGSFSEAIEELGLTTSATSHTIKRIEMGLDVVLSTHSTRSIELTGSGHYLFRKATDLLNDSCATERSIDTTSQGIEARICICINQPFCTSKHTTHLLQVLKRQFLTCRTTVTTGVYNDVWDAIINSQVDTAIDAPDTLPDSDGIGYIETGAIRRAFAIAPDYPLVFVPEPTTESQLHFYPNTVMEDIVHMINRKVGWLLHRQESILMPGFSTKCQCQILGEGIGSLPNYIVHEAMAQSLLVI